MRTLPDRPLQRLRERPVPIHTARGRTVEEIRQPPGRVVPQDRGHEFRERSAAGAAERGVGGDGEVGREVGRSGADLWGRPDRVDCVVVLSCGGRGTDCHHGYRRGEVEVCEGARAEREDASRTERIGGRVRRGDCGVGRGEAGHSVGVHGCREQRCDCGVVRQIWGQGVCDWGREGRDEYAVHAAEYAGDRPAISVPILQYLAESDPVGEEWGYRSFEIGDA